MFFDGRTILSSKPWRIKVCPPTLRPCFPFPDFPAYSPPKDVERAGAKPILKSMALHEFSGNFLPFFLSNFKTSPVKLADSSSSGSRQHFMIPNAFPLRSGSPQSLSLRDPGNSHGGSGRNSGFRCTGLFYRMEHMNLHIGNGRNEIVFRTSHAYLDGGST